MWECVRLALIGIAQAAVGTEKREGFTEKVVEVFWRLDQHQKNPGDMNHCDLLGRLVNCLVCLWLRVQ